MIGAHNRQLPFQDAFPAFFWPKLWVCLQFAVLCLQGFQRASLFCSPPALPCVLLWSLSTSLSCSFPCPMSSCGHCQSLLSLFSDSLLCQDEISLTQAPLGGGHWAGPEPTKPRLSALSGPGTLSQELLEKWKGRGPCSEVSRRKRN